MADPQKVNCHESRCKDGSYHLVFTLEGTQQAVGEIRIAADARYLKVIAQMFSTWVAMRRGPISASISNILNSRRAG